MAHVCVFKKKCPLEMICIPSVAWTDSVFNGTMPHKFKWHRHIFYNLHIFVAGYLSGLPGLPPPGGGHPGGHPGSHPGGHPGAHPGAHPGGPPLPGAPPPRQVHPGLPAYPPGKIYFFVRSMENIIHARYLKVLVADIFIFVPHNLTGVRVLFF